MNWGIGCSGVVRNGAGFWESWETRVTPGSLYFRQLQDRLGEVPVVVDGPNPAGEHTAISDASNLSSGVYLCRMDVAGEHQRFSDVKKMILTR